jgi:hypothetical protein
MENVKEKDVLINRTQMLMIARECKIFVTKSTIHRWANERSFPVVIGQNGRTLLYSKNEFVKFMKGRLRRIQELH